MTAQQEFIERYEKDFKSNQESFEKITSILEKYKEQEDVLETKIAELEAKVEEVKTDVTEVKTDVTEVKTDVEAIKKEESEENKTTATEQDNSEIDALKSENEELKKKIAELEAKLNLDVANAPVMVEKQNLKINFGNTFKESKESKLKALFKKSLVR